MLSPLNDGDRHADLRSVIYRVFGSALFAGEHSDDSGCVVYHPFVPDLEAGAGVPRTDVLHEVRCRQNIIILLLPVLTPALFKAIVWTGADQLDGVSFAAQPYDDLGSPDINTPCHARNIDIQSVSDCLTDLLFQILPDAPLAADQLLRAVSSEAHSVGSLLGLSHTDSLPAIPILSIHHTMHLFTFQVVCILQLILEVK